MSRVAKKEISIPNSVQFDCTDGIITISNGSKVLKQPLHSEVEIVKTESGLSFKPAEVEGRTRWAMAGTFRALVANMVKGVTEGFKIDLQLVGVGYRAKMDGRKVVFTLGKSHPDVYILPDSVEISIEKDVNITLKSIDKQLLGQVAANMIALRKPDAYKGKGVRMVGKVLKLKEVKKK